MNVKNLFKIKPLIRYSVGAGRRLGLYVVLNANVSDYYCSSTKSVGFKVLLHSPIEMPRISYFGMLLHPGRETQVDISPKVTSASYRARKTPLAIRRCIYPGEIQLKFFRQVFFVQFQTIKMSVNFIRFSLIFKHLFS